MSHITRALSSISTKVKNQIEYVKNNVDISFGVALLIAYGLFVAFAVIAIAWNDHERLAVWNWSAQAWSAAFTAALGFGLLFFGWVSLKAQKQYTH